LIPGFASSALTVVESPNSDWVNQRVWLSLEKIGGEKYANMLETTNNIIQATNNLVTQMSTKEGIGSLVRGVPKASMSLFKQVSSMISSKAETEEYLESPTLEVDVNTFPESPEDKVFKNKWLQHMSLQDDGCRLELFNEILS
jgi:hypothetical protein